MDCAGLARSLAAQREPASQRGVCCGWQCCLGGRAADGVGGAGCCPVVGVPAAFSRVWLVAVVTGGGWSLQVELLPW